MPTDSINIGDFFRPFDAFCIFGAANDEIAIGPFAQCHIDKQYNLVIEMPSAEERKE